jgi:zinc protease
MKYSSIRRLLPVLSIVLVIIFTPSVIKSQSVKYSLPQYVKYKLNNGLTVYLMEQHNVPVIVVSAVFDAGAVKDGERQGLASLTAEALMFGTEKYTKAELESNLEFLGASIGTGASLESASFSASFLKKDQDKVFEMAGQVLMKPVFNEQEFTKRYTRKKVELERAKESPGQVIGNYYSRYLYGNHPYGTATGGTPKGVENIKVQDLKDFYQKNYTLDRACIAIAGDFDVAAMKAQVNKYFGSWKTVKSTGQTIAAPSFNLQFPGILLIDKDNAIETRFMIGGKGIPRSNPDYIAVQVINTIFGGRFTSWLNDALRVNAGLTYGAGSNFTFNKLGGSFAISSYTRNETTVKAIDMAIDVLNMLHTKGIDEATLLSAKNYMKGGFPPRYETNSSKARLLTDMFIYGFDEKFINDFEKNVDAVTTEKAKEVISKYFPAKNLQFVLIGKASEIRDQVKKYGTLTEKNIKEEGF